MSRGYFALLEIIPSVPWDNLLNTVWFNNPDWRSYFNCGGVMGKRAIPTGRDPLKTRPCVSRLVEPRQPSQSLDGRLFSKLPIVRLLSRSWTPSAHRVCVFGVQGVGREEAPLTETPPQQRHNPGIPGSPPSR